VLPAKLDEYETERDPHTYGFAQARGNRRLSAQLLRPRDVGAQSDAWRGILLDQFRRRGVNFFQL
jgi:hypothetical protein